ncbi:protein ciao1, putative [Acanthamoeba castellanii str. Neff]|uniref:Probable cytosolic iron-sulfur protein assembly protein CIAO1 homolog n=1 Tax=Acanthamoeba castellanii (strain ATCC 30010 / Neff) TaxID=1257118 RepID=L8H563_ACACF|nr:protein ciao1, putative [Acanthamoeba castellanii str. Neff]ELR20629.1 protein ciao1, putative [Acanthamoeba castellanii str. Neff]
MEVDASASFEITQVKALQGHSDRVWHLAWSPSGNLLASCSGDKTILSSSSSSSSSATNNEHWPLALFRGPAHLLHLAAAVSALVVVAVVAREHIHLWGREGTEWVCKAILEEGHQRTIRRVEWSPCGRYLASASFDATTSIWENQQGEFECIATLEGHENEVKGVAWDASGALLATSSRDKMESNKEFECVSVLHGHTQDVKSVKWHPTKEVLVSCSYDDTIKLWADDQDDWYCLDTLTGHTSTVWEVALSKDGERMGTATHHHHHHHHHQYSPPHRLRMASTGDIIRVDWSAGGLIVSGAADDTLRIFALDAASSSADGHQEPYRLLCEKTQAHSSDINCAQNVEPMALHTWCPTDPTLLASCGDDNAVRIWQVARKA